MRARMWVALWVGFCLASIGALAEACSVHVPWVRYVNLMELSGGRVDGLTWRRIYNILDYEGSKPVVVHGIRNGNRFPVAKWRDGQQCLFDAQGAQQCEENTPRNGIRLEGLFDGWVGYSDRRDELRRVYLPLIVEVDGREHKLTLSSRPVRNTGALEDLRVARIAVEACDYMDNL